MLINAHAKFYYFHLVDARATIEHCPYNFIIRAITAPAWLSTAYVGVRARRTDSEQWNGEILKY
jgi:hypothetical protein